MRGKKSVRTLKVNKWRLQAVVEGYQEKLIEAANTQTGLYTQEEIGDTWLKFMELSSA